MHQLELIENDVVVWCQMYKRYNNDLKNVILSSSSFSSSFNVGQKSLSLRVRYTVQSNSSTRYTRFTYTFDLFSSFFFSPVQMDTQFEKRKEKKTRIDQWNTLNMSQQQLECNVRKLFSLSQRVFFVKLLNESIRLIFPCNTSWTIFTSLFFFVISFPWVSVYTYIDFLLYETKTRIVVSILDRSSNEQPLFVGWSSILWKGFIYFQTMTQIGTMRIF